LYLIIALVLVITGFILLTKGADYFIENSAALAEEKGLSPHVVGVTIVAFGTSLPELLVSIISSFQNHNDLALGNIVGSNISNIGLVLASTGFVFHYILGSNIHPEDNANKDSYVMLFAALLLLLFAQDTLISFSEGLIFFILYVLYLISLYLRPRAGSTGLKSERDTSYPFLGGGLACMLIGAHITVASAVEIASQMGISEVVIGLSVVAVGTSLPELAGTVSAARMGHKEIAIGNVIGSNIANIFLVMGILAMINAVRVEEWILNITLPLLIMLTIATLGLIRLPFGRLSGTILFGFFVLFLYQLTLV
jgi:cation:H+ antiporter